MSTSDHDANLVDASQYFWSHEKTDGKSPWPYGVNTYHITISCRIDGSIHSRSHDGQNMITTAAYQAAILEYVHEQAKVGFPCTTKTVV